MKQHLEKLSESHAILERAISGWKQRKCEWRPFWAGSARKPKKIGK